ncbi:unnamed protein product, partial [Hapterophycus canaliculatus]
RFGHFTGYGASYYAYLYAKMFTSAIWERTPILRSWSTNQKPPTRKHKRHFLGDPLNRHAGELLWKKLLIHGGAKDPHEMLQALLGD